MFSKTFFRSLSKNISISSSTLGQQLSLIHHMTVLYQPGHGFCLVGLDEVLSVRLQIILSLHTGLQIFRSFKVCHLRSCFG